MHTLKTHYFSEQFDGRTHVHVLNRGSFQNNDFSYLAIVSSFQTDKVYTIRYATTYMIITLPGDVHRAKSIGREARQIFHQTSSHVIYLELYKLSLICRIESDVNPVSKWIRVDTT